ncbi:MAG: GxxExxY protein [Anaerolineales bacterium]|nr:GxxExxY protein [Anaerolineales bacterium]MCS7017431.1 GxxExxY protein [Gemmatales bacterium]
MAEILFKELSYAIIGAAMAVHSELGPGYLEKVYSNALAHEFSLRNIHFETGVSLPVTYRGVIVGNYEADFIVEGQIVVETKVASSFHPRHEAQALNYLAATNLRLAILLNFGAEKLQYKRIVR